MDLVAQRRKHVAWCIEQSPTTITIKRTEKAPSGGGFTETVSNKGPFAVRIFGRGGGRSQNVAGLAGTQEVASGWGLLADHLADIRDGANVKDEFDAPGLGHFVVIKVDPQVTDGQVVGYQVELEKVG
jgi:hypothetical protein